ncbi:MAG: lamin tail domain-containing protein [Methanolobus sp.]
MSFKAIKGNYDAVLMVIHTDPDEASEEINSLDDVVEYSRTIYPEEQDFIIMGDFNADGSYFDEDSTSDISGTEFTWVIDNSQDTTVASSSNTYDRIVLTDNSDYISSEVFYFDDEYNLNSTQAAAVSDHYPVYAEFHIGNDRDESFSEQVIISGISLSDEWVSIQNSGASSVSMEGWTVTDDGNTHAYIFPDFILDSGATVTLHTETGVDNETDLYWESSRSIWNNDGDIASLYDSDGNLVATS